MCHSGLVSIRLIGLLFLLSSFTRHSHFAERQYILKHQDLAVSEMYAHGIPASITLAQALVESNAGRSVLAVRANNHFGIKCKSWWDGGRYYYADDDRDNGGQLTPSCFRIYHSVEESFTDHSAFLRSSERYSSLFTNGTTDYTAWANGLQRCGYATHPSYALQLIRVIEEFRLYELDR